MTARAHLLERMRRETWAARGDYTDSQATADIVRNLSHFEIWFFADCHEGGRPKYNLNFLGKWREPLGAD